MTDNVVFDNDEVDMGIVERYMYRRCSSNVAISGLFSLRLLKGAATPLLALVAHLNTQNKAYKTEKTSSNDFMMD